MFSLMAMSLASFLCDTMRLHTGNFQRKGYLVLHLSRCYHTMCKLKSIIIAILKRLATRGWQQEGGNKRMAIKKTKLHWSNLTLTEL